jgi:hypothetical protein
MASLRLFALLVWAQGDSDQAEALFDLPPEQQMVAPSDFGRVLHREYGFVLEIARPDGNENPGSTKIIVNRGGTASRPPPQVSNSPPLDFGLSLPQQSSSKTPSELHSERLETLAQSNDEQNLTWNPYSPVSAEIDSSNSNSNLSHRRVTEIVDRQSLNK